jgi:hypothetical protein
MMLPFLFRLCLVGTLFAASDTATTRAPFAPGITYAIDTLSFDANAIPPGKDALSEWAAFATFTAKVSFAAGRGRMDIVSRRDAPAILVDSMAAATPMAAPGDYYLFDSLGYLLVRPKAKTFSSFAISHDSYNYRDDRDGWPAFFQLVAPHLDTVSSAHLGRTAHRGPIRIYWHTDALPRQSIARGWVSVDDVPTGEFNVVRWFAVTRALGRLADSSHSLPRARVTVTSAIPRAAPDARGALVSFLLKQEFSQLRRDSIDLSRLVLPKGFRDVSSPRGATADVKRWGRLPSEMQSGTKR